MTTTRLFSAVATRRCHRSSSRIIRAATASLFAALFLSVFGAHAHDPGLSYAHLEISGNELIAGLTFSRRDIETLVLLDHDDDGAITTTDIASVNRDLQLLSTTLLAVTNDGFLLTPEKTTISLTAGDAINFRQHYIIDTNSQLGISSPVLQNLPRGHRQHLAIYGSTGKLQGQYIVDAKSPAIAISYGNRWSAVLQQYIGEGFSHILVGFDHILFLLTLLLPAVLIYSKPNWRAMDKLRPAFTDILKVVTAFTVAHSITLALAVLDIVSLPPRLVESVIAFSVLVTAVNNLRPVFPASRWLLAFGFGLVHGFGFASVLMNLGLPADALLVSLLGFNLGVEAGQLAIVAIVFPVAAILRHTLFYKNWVFSGGSAMAALVATVWVFERIFDFDLLGV